MTKLQKPLSQQATLQDGANPNWTEAWRRECEARDWIRRYKEKQRQVGVNKAIAWWNETISQIERIRGKAAADLLRDDMNKERNAKGGKN